MEDSWWLKMILSHGGDTEVEDNVDSIDLMWGQTPIYKAIKTHKSENVELLIKAGANLNHQDYIGVTPVMKASAYRDYKSVYQMLQAGADWQFKMPNGFDLAISCVSFPIDNPNQFPERYQYYQKVLQFLDEKGVDWEAAKKYVNNSNRKIGELY